MYTIQYTVYSIRYILHCTLHSVQLYTISIHYTLYTMKYTLYTNHYAQYSKHCKKRSPQRIMLPFCDLLITRILSLYKTNPKEPLYLSISFMLYPILRFLPRHEIFSYLLFWYYTYFYSYMLDSVNCLSDITLNLAKHFILSFAYLTLHLI